MIVKVSASILVAGVLLTACSHSDPAPTNQADTLTVADTWMKAANTGMTAAFGELKNTGSKPVHITAASSTASDHLQLHEMAKDDSGTMIMREKPGGITIAPGASEDLAPGGDHIMFLDLKGALIPGSEVPITLTFDDGSTTTFTTQVRDFAGANETYDH